MFCCLETQTDLSGSVDVEQRTSVGMRKPGEPEVI